MKVAKETGNIAPVTAQLGIMVTLAGTIGVIGVDVAVIIMDMVRWFNPEVPSIKELIVLNSNDLLAYGALSTATDSGLFGAFQTSIIGDASWKSLFPIVGAEMETLKSLAGVVSAGADLVQGKLTSQAEVYKMAKGILPSQFNLALERNLLRETGGELTSPYTRNVNYKPEHPEETKPSAKDLLWNIPSLEQAKGKQKEYLGVTKERELKRFLDKKRDVVAVHVRKIKRL